MTNPCMELYKHAEKEQKRFRANQVRLAPAPDENRFARDGAHRVRGRCRQLRAQLLEPKDVTGVQLTKQKSRDTVPATRL
jgi:hypothetical protein